MKNLKGNIMAKTNTDKIIEKKESKNETFNTKISFIQHIFFNK